MTREERKDRMSPKQYLRQAYRLNELLNSETEELSLLRQFVNNITTSDLSKKPSGSKNKDAPYTNAVNRIVDLEAKINREIDEYARLKDEIRETINGLTDNDEKLLLRCRYVNFLTWNEICEKMNISMRTVHRIHASALKNIKIP